MSTVCTKEVILSLIDDIEIVAKELLENCIAPKQKRISAADHTALTNLLVSKDKALKAALKLAGEQGKVEETIVNVRSEVEAQNQHILQLQKQLKDAEVMLSTLIFQAKQKLESIDRSGKGPVMSEDLIKYSHKISASNAVCAPLNWQQGDPRRPYPTDTEMRAGFLSRADQPMSSQLQHVTPPSHAPGTMAAPLPSHSVHSSPSRSHAQGGGHTPGSLPHSAQPHGQFTWNSAGEMSMSMGPGGPALPIEMGKSAQDDVEVMSTDSSSSSSTDSN